MISRMVKKIAALGGYRLVAIKTQSKDAYPSDFSESEIETWKAVRSSTMTSPERIVELVRSVEFIIDNKIPGDIVECGVWQGGSMILKLLI